MELHEELLALARSQPAPALKRIDAELEVGDISSSTFVRILQAGGLAARLSGDLPRSNRYLRRAIIAAGESDDTTGHAEATITLAGNVFLAGKPQQALKMLAALDIPADPQLTARIGLQTGTIYARTNQFELAVAAFDRGLDAATKARDSRLVAVVTKNRGMLRAYSGEYRQATADLEFARTRFADLGIDIEVAYCTHDLGLVALYSGDLPSALAHLAEAEDAVARLAASEWELQVARCEALLTAGLAEEAATIASSSAAAMDAADHSLDRAEALLVGARAELLRGETTAARDLAATAAAVFADQDRPAWSAHARLIALTTERVGPDGVAAIHRLAADLASGGLADANLTAELAAAEVETETNPTRAIEQIDALAGRLRNARLDQRLTAATTLAAARLAVGDSRGADAAARTAFRTILDAQAFLGQPDLRVGVARHGAPAGDIGLGLALASGRPRRVLAWLERIKTAIQQTAPISIDDDRLRSALTEYRSLSSLAADPTLERRRVRAERRIRNWSRAAAGRPSHWKPLPNTDLLAALDGTTLVSFGVHDGELFAVQATAQRVSLHRLGSSSAASAAARQARAGLRSVATGLTSTPPHEALLLLDQQLVEALATEASSLILAPTPELFGVPWGALPSLHGVPIAVVPSATAWATRRPPSSARSRPLLVGGPDLATGGAEIEAIRHLWEEPQILLGADATVEATLAGFDEAPVAHIVAHGSNRIDNPLFSSLRLADGPFNVYELERVPNPPAAVVLSACHVGLAEATPGRELLGLVGGLLGVGVRTVVASTLPLPDTAPTIDFMTTLHRHLAAGIPPTAALLAAQSTIDDPALATLYRGSVGVFGGD